MRANKSIVAAILVVVLLAAGGGVAWYMSIPHTPEEQFAYAEKLEKALRGDALVKSTKDLAPQIDATVEQYERVGTRFGKSPKAAEALQRVVKIDEEIAKDDAKSTARLDQIIKDYPDDEHAGSALIEEAGILRKQANDMKAAKSGDAVARYKEAIAKLDEYRKQFAQGKQADGALMETGRIWQEGIGDPPIRAIETFERVLKEYPSSNHKAEAMYRLAKLYETIKEYARALQLYSQLLEEFPQNKWADDATFARAKILDDQMKKHDEAAKEFDRLRKDYPDSPLGGQAAGEAKKARGEQASAEGESYGKSRYGGTVPYDTINDKPRPPSGMFRQFAEEKLDAQKYDLNVTLAPKEHRITVEGSLNLINGGDDKKELLLMLGAPLTLSTLTVNGAAAKFEHQGETLKVDLPAELKKDATATIAFAYTGQYAEPMSGFTPGSPTETKTTEPPGDEAATSQPAATSASTKPSKFAVNPQIGLGEFGYALSGASWYPITILGDVFDAHVVIHTPANLEAVSNGEIIKRAKSTVATVPGVFEFQTKAPVFGLYFAYGPYTVQEKQVGSIHYYTYLRPQNASKHDAYIEVTNRILSFYGSKFVPFPYEKMAMIETPLPPFLGGVGPASLMFLHEKMVAHEEVPENLLAHELAHQWFGNLVPINIADPNYNQWLSEGFATYCDALYTEHLSGRDALAKHMQRYGQLFFQFELMAPRGKGAIRDTFPDSPLYRPVIYEKGAIVLHMLRKVMGDEKFFTLMRQFVETYKNKPSTVDDFRRMASSIHGQDLSWFFSQWIDQTVFAHWTVKAEITGGDKPGETATVKLFITQPDDLVKMPVDITLVGDGGQEKVLPNVMLDQKEQTVDATAPFKPVKVILDKDFWVLHRPGSDNVWPPEKVAATVH